MANVPRLFGLLYCSFTFMDVLSRVPVELGILVVF